MNKKIIITIGTVALLACMTIVSAEASDETENKGLVVFTGASGDVYSQPVILFRPNVQIDIVNGWVSTLQGQNYGSSEYESIHMMCFFGSISRNSVSTGISEIRGIGLGVKFYVRD